MNKIFYFSGSGKSRRLAEYIGEKLKFPIYDIVNYAGDFSAETAVIIFPVYCQNLPEPVRNFIPKLKSEKIAFAATYGKKSFGNVIEDAVMLSSSVFIGGICLPTGHSFLKEPDCFHLYSIDVFVDKIRNQTPAEITSYKKDFYADLVPATRTQLCVKINKNSSCTNCGICEKICPVGAIQNAKINNRCIRCLNCVTNCPENALDFKINSILRIYLKNNRKNGVKFFF